MQSHLGKVVKDIAGEFARNPPYFQPGSQPGSHHGSRSGSQHGGSSPYTAHSMTSQAYSSGSRLAEPPPRPARPLAKAKLPNLPGSFPEMERLSLDELSNLADVDNIQVVFLEP